MKIFTISIGDELLIGQTINTNSAWLGEQFSIRGAEIVGGITVSDKKESIIEALDLAKRKANIVILTGGLGPTKDDITKRVLCEYFESSLVLNQEVLTRIEELFSARKRLVTEMAKMQAFLPEKATILNNSEGTASGMWFEKDDVVFISLPGVPYEMKSIMEKNGFPKLFKKSQQGNRYYQSIELQGIGESYFAEVMRDWEDRVEAKGWDLAYLPSIGLLKLRITTSKGEEEKEEIKAFFLEVEEKFPIHFLGFDPINLSALVGEMLLDKGLKIGTVESCTGGMIASELISVSGASQYFEGGIVTYSNEQKKILAGVDAALLTKYGSVSGEVCSAMAQGGRMRLGVDYCIAVTGIAGPNGGDELSPVGTVWIALASSDEVIVKRFNFGKDRGRTLRMTVLTALNIFRCKLLNISM